MDILHYAIFLMSLNLYHEARGEPIEGQIAICHVVMNRAHDDLYKVEDVIFKPKQFNWTAVKGLRLSDMSAYNKCKDAVMMCMEERKTGMTGEGATHYHTIYVHPYWAYTMEKLYTIGDHIFYKK